MGFTPNVNQGPNVLQTHIFELNKLNKKQI